MTDATPAITATLPTGFTMRPVVMDDLENAVALLNAWTRSRFGADEIEIHRIRQEWETPEFDLATSTRAVFGPEGQMVAYAEVWDTDAVPVHPNLWARVHPQFEGRGLGTAIMTWAEDRARQAIDRCPPEARVTLHAGANADDEVARSFLADRGYEPVRYWWTMMIDRPEVVPEPQIPEGISIRTYNHPDEFEAVAKADDDAFRDHWGYVEEPIEELIRRWRDWINRDQDFDPSLWFLAVDDASGEIAGVSLCRGKMRGNPDVGYIGSLGVRRPWRKRGLGLALLHYSFQEFWQRGKQQVGLGVDATSLTGATRLYEKGGMYTERQGVSYEKEIRPGKEWSTTHVEE